MQLFRSFLRDRRGATAIEYCFIASLVALVIFASIGVVGTKLNRTYNRVSQGLN